MRDQAEIQRAHDILVAVKLGDVPVVVPDEHEERLTAFVDVLCWVLAHDHNNSFSLNLAALEAAIAETGAVLIDAGRPAARKLD